MVLSNTIMGREFRPGRPDRAAAHEVFPLKLVGGIERCSEARLMLASHFKLQQKLFDIVVVVLGLTQKASNVRFVTPPWSIFSGLEDMSGG